MKKSGGFANILKGLEDKTGSKVAAKLPEWKDVEGLVFPGALCLEQCSSNATANYKARLLKSVLPENPIIADLTSGLGVDCWSFSKFASKVLYFEQQEELCNAAKSNFELLTKSLGIDNRIECRCQVSDSETISLLPEMDAIYMDPARRNDLGKKVFLLEDCTPDVLGLIPRLCKKTGILLLKLSPMADITMVTKRLDSAFISCESDMRVKEVHVVCLSGEVKELLILCTKSEGGYSLTASDLDKDQSISFLPSEEADGPVSFLKEDDSPLYLYEPSPALMKAGFFKSPCSRFSLKKASPDCHIYFSSNNLEAPLFRKYEIRLFCGLDKKTMREAAKSYPIAEVSAKAVPLSSEELKARLGVKSGIASDGAHYKIFGLQCTFGRLLVVGKTV